MTRIKFWQSGSQGMVAREGAYLAVFGLKTQLALSHIMLH